MGHSILRIADNTAGTIWKVAYAGTAAPDRVLPELRPFGGTVLQTSLSNEQEERLRQALQEVQA